MWRVQIVLAAFWLAGVAWGQTWTETQIFAPADAQQFASYGDHVVIDDGWVGMSASGLDPRVFFLRKSDTGEWVQTQALASTPTQGDSFSMSGPVVVLGQQFFPSSTAPFSMGTAMIFERDQNDVWSQTTVLQPDDLTSRANFGRFVAASGDRIAILAGYTFSSEPRDAIYVYRREGFGQWVLEDRISLFEGNDNTERYRSMGMGMDGDTIVLFEVRGGGKNPCSVRFEAYERGENNQWTMRTRIQEDGQSCSNFSVAVSGNIALVGDSTLESFQGGVRVYRRNAEGSWIRGENLIPADIPPFSSVGSSIAFDGLTLLVTTPFEDLVRNRFFVFGLQPDGTFADLGVQPSALFPPSSNTGYGRAIGIDGDDAVVGVPAADNAFPGQFSGGGALAFYEREPTALDTDGDGLLDDWEINGIPYAKADGTTGRLILPQADPLRKNMYIEVDAALIEMPQPAMDQVIQAFDRAPVTNPDGSTGIILHIVLDETKVPTPNSVVNGDTFPLNFDSLREERFGTVEERDGPDAAALLGAKAKAYRWCFAYSGIQFAPGTAYYGRGKIPGPSFLIDLDNEIFDVVLHPVTGPQEIASTFMHELGHALGLRHGGSDDRHGKPNYPSVMNYALTHITPWNRSFRRLDYSREELEPLHESALDETRGINSAKYRRYRMPFGVGPDQNRRFSFVRLTGRPTDFNGNGVRQGVVEQDLNFMPTIDFPGVTQPSPGEPLPGQNDWAVIRYAPPSGRGGEESSGCTNPTVYEFLSTQVDLPCEPDFNDDGLINFFDLRDYLLAYNAGDLEADLAEPFDTLNFFDIARFVQDFAAGCP